jgi:hypothetical protein
MSFKKTQARCGFQGWREHYLKAKLDQPEQIMQNEKQIRQNEGV